MEKMMSCEVTAWCLFCSCSAFVDTNMFFVDDWVLFLFLNDSVLCCSLVSFLADKLGSLWLLNTYGWSVHVISGNVQMPSILLCSCFFLYKCKCKAVVTLQFMWQMAGRQVSKQAAQVAGSLGGPINSVARHFTEQFGKALCDVPPPSLFNWLKRV